MHLSSDRFLRLVDPPRTLVPTPESLAVLRAALLGRVAADPVAPVVIDLDGLPLLDTPTISALIRLGRDVRERGGSLSLAGGSAAVLETLRITALGRVFPMLERDATVAPPRRSGGGGRTRIACVALAFLVAGSAVLGVRGPADSGSIAPAAARSPEEIIANVVAQNPAMRTYEANLAVDLHLKSFPWLSQHLDATTYYKRPDNYEVVFHDVPSYARGFEKLYSDIDDPSGWEKRFAMSLVGTRAVGNRQDVVVRLVQRVRGMIDHQDVAIDVDHWRIDQMEWHYYNGGEISMTQDYVAAGPYTVLAAQHATIRIPHVSASAEASYTDYHTNVPIDDAVFSKSAGQAAP